MFEESPDGFISRWRKHAAAVTVFSRTEGLPLLEVELGGAILQVLERTGPYMATPGRAKAIINPTTARVEVHSGGNRSVDVAAIGRMRGCGLVIHREEPFLVLDVGAPVVLGVVDPLPDDAVPGAWVSFESIPPIHGFLVPEPRSSLMRAEGDSI